MLKNGNIPQKQIAALKFDYVKSKEDAEAMKAKFEEAGAVVELA